MISAGIPNEVLPFGSASLGLVSTIPLYIAIRKSRTQKDAFIICFINAAAVNLMSSFWLGNFHGFAMFTLGASTIGTGFVMAFISQAFYLPVLLQENWTGGKLFASADENAPWITLRTLWFASVYTIWEWCKSSGFLGYPWGTLSMTAYTVPFLTQIADITGTYGVTFLMAFFAASSGEALVLMQKSAHLARLSSRGAAARAFETCAALFALSVAYGAFEYAKPRTQTKTLNAVLVQQNGDPWLKGEANSIRVSKELTEKKIGEMRSVGEECDLVVWSEAVLTKRFPNARSYYASFPEDEPLLDFIKRMDTPFVIGGPVTLNLKMRQYGNSALLFDRHGDYKGSYQKMHLVPFAELIPGVQIEFVRNIMKSMVGFSYGWYPGKCVTTFEIPISGNAKDTRLRKTISIVEGAGPDEYPEKPRDSVVIATPICFDDTAVEVCRAMFLSGSEVFINVTNDAWSRTESAETQHAVVAHYRAIEYRTTLARCTNAGYTVVFGPNGRDLSNLPLFVEDALAARIPVFERQITLYARLGNWLPKTLAALVLAFSALARFGRKTRLIAALKEGF